jgi:hypothetical protein
MYLPKCMRLSVMSLTITFLIVVLVYSNIKSIALVLNITFSLSAICLNQLLSSSSAAVGLFLGFVSKQSLTIVLAWSKSLSQSLSSKLTIPLDILIFNSETVFPPNGWYPHKYRYARTPKLQISHFSL